MDPEEERGRRSRAPTPASDIRDRDPDSPDSRSPSPESQAFEAGLAGIYRTENPRTIPSSESGDSDLDDSDYSPERSDILSPWLILALEELTLTSTGSEATTDRSGTSSTGLTDALEDLTLPSDSGASRTEDGQNEQYNFSPERRDALMRQMHRDIAGYDAARERAFGREHGYEVYPSTPEPPASRGKRRRDNSRNSDASLNERIGRNSAWRAASPSLSEIITELISSRPVSRERDRSSSPARTASPSLTENVTEFIRSRRVRREQGRQFPPTRTASEASAHRSRRNSSSSPARSDAGSEEMLVDPHGLPYERSPVLSSRSLRRSSSQGTRAGAGSLPRTPVRIQSPERVDRGPLTSHSRNPIDDFLDELCSDASRAGREMLAYNHDHPGFAHSQGSENESYIFSVLRDLPEYDSSIVDRLHFEEAEARLQDTLQRRMIVAAVADGMDPREACEFLQAWRRFARNKEWNDVPGMLSMRHMQFWSALRKGWGTERWSIWRPSDRFLAQVRTMLLEGLRFTHTPWEGSYAGSSGTDPMANLTSRIADSGLPREEIERLNELFGGDREWTRIARTFHEWLAAAEFVQQQRIAGEMSLSIEDIRLDRLERLIREEWLLNGVRRIPGPPPPRRRRRRS